MVPVPVEVGVVVAEPVLGPVPVLVVVPLEEAVAPGLLIAVLPAVGTCIPVPDAVTSWALYCPLQVAFPAASRPQVSPEARNMIKGLN